jgi:hypothetical protein
MKTIGRKVIIASIVILGLCLMNTNVLADPTVDSVTTDPPNPKQQSTITVTAKVTGDDVQSVVLWIGECSSADGICFIWEDYEMSLNPDGEWEKTATLKDTSGRADYISYKFDIDDGGTIYNLDTIDDWEIDLTIESGNGGDDDDNGSPGFEILTFIVAIGVALILIKRKRS